MKKLCKSFAAILAALLLFAGCKQNADHVHTEDNGTVTIAPTCTTKGTKTYKCSVCGEVIRTEEIAAKGHSEDSGTVTTAPTCVTKGTKTYKCSVCGEVTRTEEIAAKGHSEDIGTVTTAPTCTTKGTKTYKCTVCGEVARTEEIAAKGHSEDSGTVTTAPTCVTKGIKTYKCTECGEVIRTEEIAELYSSPIDVTTGSAATSSSTYVYFGVFPKTVLASTSTVTVDEETRVTMGGNTYYKGSDGEYYAKVTVNPYDSSYTYEDTTAVTSGEERYFKVEPIKWKVLTTEYDIDGTSGSKTGALLFAEEILTANVPYYSWDESTESRSVGTDTTIYPNNYKYSQIRAYLNGLDYYNDSNTTVSDYNSKGFLQSAFSDAAQKIINKTIVKNDGLSTTDVGMNITRADGKSADGTTSTGNTDYTCADTEDKIFLLSEYEVTKYSTEAYDDRGAGNSRIRKTTDYAKANYAYQSSTDDYGGWWWLRSPDYESSNFACLVDHDGYANSIYIVDQQLRGVVPALSISLQ